MSVVDIGDGDKFLDYIRSLQAPERDALFLKCVGRGDVTRAEQFLQGGADVNCGGGAALIAAARLSRENPAETAEPMIDLLIRKGIALEGCRDAALTEAAASGDGGAVSLLLHLGADPARNDSASLFAAVVNNHAEAADLLLDGGADAQANKGTLLGIALSRKFTEAAGSLLRHGADPGRLYRDMNAYEWSAETGQADFLELLRNRKPPERGLEDAYMSPGYFRCRTLAQLREEQEQGRTGFHLAAMAGCFDIVCGGILATPGETLRAEDLLHKDRDGHSALSALGESGRLGQAFEARLWAGRKREMLSILDQAPAAFLRQVDVPALVAELDRLTLKTRVQKTSLKLKAS